MKNIILLLGCLSAALLSVVWAQGSCQFASDFSCDSFQSEEMQRKYLDLVMQWEGQFAQAGVGFDATSGYSLDGHPLDYASGELWGQPHLFSAPSKESIHLGILALAIDGNVHAQRFCGGLKRAFSILESKIRGYEKFNSRFPGFGCFTPWVGFDQEGISPLPDWADRVPGLDNGEWFWALYATAHVLESRHANTHPALAQAYRSLVDCQKRAAKAVFYRGAGDVSAVISIRNTSAEVQPTNYFNSQGLLNDPYEGETMTVLLHLFADWSEPEERNLLWEKKRALFQKTDFSSTQDNQTWTLTVQRGWWFSTHEQWKTLLLPYLSIPLVKKVFANAEKARLLDARETKLPGLLASVNDVTDGGETIPDYASACGVPALAMEKVERRDLLTPYASFALFLHDRAAGFCWYNSMLQGPRMQTRFGSVEAINANGTEISPLMTWDSKATTVLAMLGGLGALTERALKNDRVKSTGENALDAFLAVVQREHAHLFGSVEEVKGEEVPFVRPSVAVPRDKLADWKIAC